MSSFAMWLAVVLSAGAPVGWLEGGWRCEVPHHGRLELKIVPVEATKSAAARSDAFELFASGPAASVLPATAAMLTVDRGNTLLTLSGTGECAPPGPISDDDEPESGAPRCARFEATAAGWHGGALHWKLTGTKTTGARYALKLHLARLGAKAMHLTLLDSSGKRLGGARCNRL